MTWYDMAVGARSTAYGVASRSLVAPVVVTGVPRYDDSLGAAVCVCEDIVLTRCC